MNVTFPALPRHERGNGSLAAPIAEAAAGYARRGLWVVALTHVRPDGSCSCGDPLCPTPGKHLRNKCATRSPEVIREWWRRWPEANVGLATGKENGLVVLDVDPKDGGMRSLSRLVFRIGPLPTTKVRTGGGGLHLYFRHPGVPVDSRNGWREGIDVRGDGGYVVVPPSLHQSGRAYVWVTSGATLPRLPTRLRHLLTRG